MSNLVTEARVEIYSLGTWGRITNDATTPESVESGRLWRRKEIEQAVFPDEPPPRPVRVIDSAGVVVAQWGKP